MKPIGAEDLLNAWERGLNQPLLQKALVLLTAAFPETDTDTLLKLSIGQRDLRLLKLRESLFGRQLCNTALCPQCDERVEWENSIAEFLVNSDPGNETLNEFDLEADGYSLRFCLPNSLDIAAVVNAEDVDTAQQHLLSRCLLKVECGGKSCKPDQLPESVIELLDQRIERLDPQADIRIQIKCPQCSHHWNLLFDIASYLWTEVNEWAQQLLLVVYKLASAYGWSEREILNLSPVRRQLYLGLLQQ